MKRIFLFFNAMAFISIAQAQVERRANPRTDSAQIKVSTVRSSIIQRMTLAQRNLLSRPAEGLKIYQTDNQAGIYEFHSGEWIKLPVSIHYIGEHFGGGIVFYVTPDALHGLIAEKQDQSSGVSWFSAQNEISMEANHSEEGKNFTDWRLPTKNELNLLYGQKDGIGSFTSGLYWSCSEIDSNRAWVLYFSSGNPNFNGKNGLNHVRAVRSF